MVMQCKVSGYIMLARTGDEPRLIIVLISGCGSWSSSISLIVVKGDSRDN